jgi:hypothetical protein
MRVLKITDTELSIDIKSFFQKVSVHYFILSVKLMLQEAIERSR